MTTTRDSWFNPITGVGGAADKTSGFTFGVGTWMSWDVPYLLDELYRADELARVKVDAVVDDSFMKGWSVESDLTSEQSEALTDFNDRMGITQTVIDADKWARLFGGAAVFMGHEDALATQDMPLQLGGRLCFAQAYERSELQVARWYENPMSPKFGRPSHYRLSPYAMSGGGAKAATNSDIHESRFLLFYGDRATKRQRVDAQGWGQSVLLRCMTALKQYNGAYALMLSLLADANQNIYKLEGFSDLLRNGQGDLVQKRIEIIDKFRSATKALIVDAQHEDFVRSSLSLSGLDNIVTKYTERVASAFEMPLTRLFGVSPAGLNATGESDLRTWNKQVENHRTMVVTPQLDRWLRVVLHAKNGPTGGFVPSSFKVKWPSLWDMSPREEAEVDSINAQTDRSYQEIGILKTKHIASRFTGDRLRPSLSKEDIDQIEADEALLTPPPAPAEDVPPPDGETDSVDALGEEAPPPIDTDLIKFVGDMNQHQAVACRHGSKNRCRVCGIERVPTVAVGPAGEIVYPLKWRPIGMTTDALDAYNPSQPRDGEGQFGEGSGGASSGATKSGKHEQRSTAKTHVATAHAADRERTAKAKARLPDAKLELKHATKRVDDHDAAMGQTFGAKKLAKLEELHARQSQVNVLADRIRSVEAGEPAHSPGQLAVKQDLPGAKRQLAEAHDHVSKLHTEVGEHLPKYAELRAQSAALTSQADDVAREVADHERIVKGEAKREKAFGELSAAVEAGDHKAIKKAQAKAAKALADSDDDIFEHEAFNRLHPEESDLGGAFKD